MSLIRVGIAVVMRNEQVLVGVRDIHAVQGGKHEFPGGKCLPDETSADCAIRECFEETGLQVSVLELLNRVQHVYEHGQVDLSFWICRLATEQQHLPGGNFQWMPLNTLSECHFPAANQSALEILIKRWRQGEFSGID